MQNCLRCSLQDRPVAAGKHVFTCTVRIDWKASRNSLEGPGINTVFQKLKKDFISFGYGHEQRGHTIESLAELVRLMQSNFSWGHSIALLDLLAVALE
eukprot:CFRG8565T1